jgi:hypothetical protein
VDKVVKKEVPFEVERVSRRSRLAFDQCLQSRLALLSLYAADNHG